MKIMQEFDVAIVGAGASGTALLWELATYTNVGKIVLFEKYDQPALVNSHNKNNSQTLHVGDIETNYSLDKAKRVKPGAMMVPAYVKKLSKLNQKKILFEVQKMVLAVGEDEVFRLNERFLEFRSLYPDLEVLDREGIAGVEPLVVEGRAAVEPILALFSKRGYAVDYRALAESFVDESRKNGGKRVTLKFKEKVEKFEKRSDGYVVVTKKGEYRAKTVVVDADSYSLYMAKKLGYGKEFSLIPIDGNFYYSRKVLNGKVYTMQEPKLPFAAVHGDPDVAVPGKTRWGPTARFFPKLESDRPESVVDFFVAVGLTPAALVSYAKILLDPVRFWFLVKNLLFDLPYIGKRMFLKNVTKIVPTLAADDLEFAKGVGGMRLQRVDTRTRELLLGEGRIEGDKILFNMTPSPGASVCLANARDDVKTVVKWLGKDVRFDEKKLVSDLVKDAD